MELIDRLYRGQSEWGSRTIRARAAIASNFTDLIAERWQELADAIEIPERTGVRETISAEILPLASASYFLSKRAVAILRPRYARSRDLPLWMGAIRSQVRREPYGVVMIIGTWNYPIFLTGVQMLQALVAGNAVLLKPAPGAEQVTGKLMELAFDAGFPRDCVSVVSPDPASAQAIIEAGVDHVVLTGSSQTGRVVAGQLAKHLTPSTMELSGCDAVLVLQGADVQRVVSALKFGLRLNSGATCMAPRRLLVLESLSEVFHRLLNEMLDGLTSERFMVRVRTAARVIELTQNALDRGATHASQQLKHAFEQFNGQFAPQSTDSHVEMPAIVLTNVTSQMAIANADVFAPVLAILEAKGTSEAIDVANQCPYALTTSVFSTRAVFEIASSELRSGVCVLNDLIAPNADPRVPFGGWDESGFGVTQGPEGLLAMTRIKTVARRKGRWLPHLDDPQESDSELLAGLLQWSYSHAWRKRMRGLQQVWQAIRTRGRK